MISSHARLRRAVALVATVIVLPPALATAGASPGQAAGPVQSGATLVINEIDYTQRGGDVAEFVEILNVGREAVSLFDFALVGIKRDGRDGIVVRRDRLLGVDLVPGDVFVVCGSRQVPNCDQALDITDAWADGEDEPSAVALVRIDPLAPTNPRVDVLVDSVSYGGDMPGGPPTGGTWTEGSGVVDGDLDALPFVGLSRLPDGTDTDVNAADLTRRCITPGAPNVADVAQCRAPEAAPGSHTFVINELDPAQPAAPDKAEFVELANVGPVPLSLDGYILVGISGSIRGETETVFEEPLPDAIVPPGGHFVACKSPDNVPNCDHVMRTGAQTGFLRDAFDDDQLPHAVALIRRPTGLPRDDVLVDAVSYDGAVPGGPATGGGWTEGTPVTEGDTNNSDFVGLSRLPDGADTDDNAADLTTRCITPGYENTAGTGALAPCPAGKERTPTPDPTATATATIPPTRPPTATPTGQPGTPSPTPTDSTPPTGIELMVDSSADAPDLQPGDGACRTATGACTLRAALAEANALTGNEPVRITFAGSMRIAVPPGAPLPALSRDQTIIDGSVPDNPVTGTDWTGADGPAAQLGVELAGPGDARTGVGLELDGVSGAVVRGLDLSGFQVGIALVNGATGNVIGADGGDPTAGGNHVHGNRLDGIVIDATSTGNFVRGNQIDLNRRAGIRLGRTLAAANLLSRNQITANGGPAIAIDPRGPELTPPTVTVAEPSTGTVAGQACSLCVVEVFADPGDEAAVFLGEVTAAPSGGWSLTGLALERTDLAHVAATARDRLGSTSRLSAAAPIGRPWRLIAVPPEAPRALGRDLALRRRYRLLDETGVPVADARLRFAPLNLAFDTGPGGLVDVTVPLPDVIGEHDPFAALSVEAVERRGGAVHAVEWLPRLAIAAWQPNAGPRGLLLGLTNLSPEGLGAAMRRPAGPISMVAAAARPAPRSTGSTSMVAAEGAYGAAFLAAPVETLREGPYAWQENLARGGGIYELRPADVALEGELEIVAPIEAYTAGEAASACPGSAAGTTMAGWAEDERCWVPVDGTVVAAPDPGATTLTVSALVSVPPAGTFARAAHAPLQATGVFTLYTVGFDTDPPIITPALAPGAAISALPAVLGEVRDALSGVRAATGVQVTLGGQPVAVDYDPTTFEVRVPAESRALPPGLSGPTALVIAATDGFCNADSVTVLVTLEPGAATPTSGPPAPGIYLPFALKR